MHLPPGPEALTGPWLTQALRSTGTIGNETSVVSFHFLNAEDELGIAGQHARVGLDYDQAADHAPHSVFAKFAVTDPEVRKLMHGYKVFLRESKFYQELAGQAPLRTPRCYYSDLDMATGEFVLLLEDMSEWRSGSFVAGCSAQEAEPVVRNLARLHATWWERPQLEELDYAEADSADFEWRRATFLQHWQSFLERRGESLPTELVEVSERVARHILEVLTQLHHTPPRTLIHYDCHLDNLFFRTTAEGHIAVAVIDWQLYFIGQGAYDVAYFLAGNLEPDTKRSCEMGLLQTYHELLREGGVLDYSFETLLNDYRTFLLEGFFRMVSIPVFFNLSPEQERVHLEVYAVRFLQAVQDHDAVALLPA